MAIEVLCKLPDATTMQDKLEYHPTCKTIGLTHLGFADDLLVFFKGTPQSIRAVLEVFLWVLQYVRAQIEPH